MKKFRGFLAFVLTAVVVLTASLAGSAQGTSTVTQVGLENFVYHYQELLSELVILQLGDENRAAVEQLGPEHIAGLSQIGERNSLEIWQLGQRDLVLAVQNGGGNDAKVSQMHSPEGATGVSDNDAFSYQGGMYNTLNLLQVGDENTASIYQIDSHNEVFVVQEQSPLGAGKTAALIVQAGLNNWTSAVQLGAHHLLRSLQVGDDNSSTIMQSGQENRVSVVQDGSKNVFSAIQS